MSDNAINTNIASARTDINQFIPWVPNFKAKDFQTLKVKAGQNNSFEVYAISDQNDDKPEMFFVAMSDFKTPESF